MNKRQRDYMYMCYVLYGIVASLLCDNEFAVEPNRCFLTNNSQVAVKQILKNLGIWNPRGCLAKSLPWKTSANERRSCEDVRPIFWSCRPKSYIHRTQDWDKVRIPPL